MSIVAVTYQSAEHIARCLSGIEGGGLTVPPQVVVVDNGSADDTVEHAQHGWPTAVIVQGQGNVGFARGCNLGAAQATGSHLLFLNPDTELRPGALQALLAAAERNPEAGLWGGRTVRPDGGVDETCAFGAMSPWSLFCFAIGLSSLFPRSRWFDPESLGGWGRDTAREVSVLSGACLLVSREAWSRLGGFDERYFMYAEDADLCRRAWQAGYRPRLVPEAELVHDVGASSDPGAKQVMLHRGKATYLRLHWSPVAGRFGLGCLWLGVALRARLADRRPAGSTRRQTLPSAWTTAWQLRHQWLGGW